ncbi:MAG: class I SAM-dependent methyltransferase [Candidatus Pacebacteria bacterium]|nr:class I SAM-dependent methyltransferase [Candidatus Paceibacterota bacterium]
METSWKKYIDKTSESKTRPLLVEALQFVKSKGEALDLGSGAQLDSKHLLSEGFKHVTSIDSDKTAEEYAKRIDSRNFSFVRSKFEDFTFPKEHFDVINAQFSLSYISPENFNLVMERIKASLKTGGIFAGQIFGDYDQSIIPGVRLTYLSKKQTEDLFSGMEIIKIEEKDVKKKSALGKLKRFHQFHFITRKK